MAKRDYYEILGIEKKASADEIKRAFRSKARHLHPDNKDSGDEAAFKELAEAYEVLSDDNRRSRYDRYGHEGVKGITSGFEDVDFSAFAGFGIDDLIDVFFGGGLRSSGRRGGVEQGAHLKYDLQIEFLEAVFGTEKKVSIRRLEDCVTCSGNGAAPGSNPVSCNACGGMGQVQQVVNSWFGQSIRVLDCPTCQGVGTKIDKPCRECRGEGLLKKTREFDLKIPAGIEDGSRLRLASGGDKGKRGGTFGDLFVVLHVSSHEVFIREGLTIHLNQSISFSMAALGGELLIPTVDGEVSVKVPAGTQTGTMIVLKEHGIPRLGDKIRRGDQVVHFVIQTPSKLTSEERRLFEKLAEIRGEKLKANSVDKVDKANSTHEDKVITETNILSKGSEKVSDKVNKRPNRESGKNSTLNKIVDAFRPKNGEQEYK